MLFDVVVLLNDVNDLRGGFDDEILEGLVKFSLDDIFVVVNVFLVIIDVEFNLSDRIVVVKIIFVLLLFLIVIEIFKIIYMCLKLYEFKVKIK